MARALARGIWFWRGVWPRPYCVRLMPTMTTVANHVLTLSRLLQACMHLHHDTRPGLWHAVFGFGAGFGARARGLASSVRSLHAAWLHCRRCCVARLMLLDSSLDACSCSSLTFGTRAPLLRGVQPYVAVSLLRPCTPAANGRTRTCSRNYYFPFPHTNMLHVIGRGGRVGSQLRIFKQALRLSRGARGALKTHLRLSRGTRTGPRNPDVSG